jgi:hypothetical protein
MLDRLFVAIQVIINDFSVYFYFLVLMTFVYIPRVAQCLGLNMILSYCCLLSVFVLSFIGNTGHAIAHPSVATHVSVVRKPTHEQLYSFESLIVFCM